MFFPFFYSAFFNPITLPSLEANEKQLAGWRSGEILPWLVKYLTVKSFLPDDILLSCHSLVLHFLCFTARRSLWCFSALILCKSWRNFLPNSLLQSKVESSTLMDMKVCIIGFYDACRRIDVFQNFEGPPKIPLLTELKI